MRHTCTTGLSLILYLYFWSLWFSNSTPVGRPKDHKRKPGQCTRGRIAPAGARHLARTSSCSVSTLSPAFVTSWHCHAGTRTLSWRDISHVISTRKIRGTSWQLADSADIWHNTSLMLWVASVLYIALMLGNASLALWLCCKDRKMLYFWHATEKFRNWPLIRIALNIIM